MRRERPWRLRRAIREARQVCCCVRRFRSGRFSSRLRLLSDPGRTALDRAFNCQGRRLVPGGTLTCHELVEQYLGRIRAYDQQGPALKAMLYVNPRSFAEADAMDQEFERTHKLKPLGCIPIVLKDNFDTADMPTTAGALTLKGAQPERDAFAVKRLREAGALILAKANMSEFATGGISASSLGG